MEQSPPASNVHVRSNKVGPKLPRGRNSTGRFKRADTGGLARSVLGLSRQPVSRVPVPNAPSTIKWVVDFAGGGHGSTLLMIADKHMARLCL